LIIVNKYQFSTHTYLLFWNLMIGEFFYYFSRVPC